MYTEAYSLNKLILKLLLVKSNIKKNCLHVVFLPTVLWVPCSLDQSTVVYFKKYTLAEQRIQPLQQKTLEEQIWQIKGFNEGGVAALRVLEENVKIYLTFYEKSFIKGTLKPKIEKRALLLLFYCLLSDICKKKIANFSQSSLWRSYSFD